jgi:cytochrome P450
MRNLLGRDRGPEGDANRPPGPPSALPLALLALKGDLLGVYARLGSYGDLSYMQFLDHHVYMVQDPEDIFTVLVTDNRKFMKGQATHEAKRLLGEGLLSSNGELHARQRKLLQPAFHPSRLEHQGAIAVKHATELSNRWVDGETVDVGSTMMHLTLTILGDAILDYDLAGHVDTFADALDAAVDMVEQVLRPWGPMLEKLPLPVMRRFRSTRERLYTLCDEIIAKRRANLDGGDDLISLMLGRQAEMGDDVLTDTQIRDELVTIILTGHETLTQQLTWTYYLLGSHPEVVATLHEELDTVLGGATPTLAHLESLPWTEKILLEAMRVYPPVYALQRRALVDYEVGSYPVPEGSLLVCSQYLLHRSERWFTDPERFDPSRWTDEFHRSLPGMCYFPFGRGPRSCIGEAFAMVEARLLLATLFQGWRVRGVPGEPVGTVSSISLRPDAPVHVVLERRQAGE